jgi:hypothetical protein
MKTGDYTDYTILLEAKGKYRGVSCRRRPRSDVNNIFLDQPPSRGPDVKGKGVFGSKYLFEFALIMDRSQA